MVLLPNIMNKNPCLEVGKNPSPGRLQGAKHPHVQGLELICQIWRKPHEGEVVRLAQVDHLRRDVAGQIVANEQLFGGLLFSLGRRRSINHISDQYMSNHPLFE